MHEIGRREKSTQRIMNSSVPLGWHIKIRDQINRIYDIIYMKSWNVINGCVMPDKTTCMENDDKSTTRGNSSGSCKRVDEKRRAACLNILLRTYNIITGQKIFARCKFVVVFTVNHILSSTTRRLLFYTSHPEGTTNTVCTSTGSANSRRASMFERCHKISVDPFLP